MTEPKVFLVRAGKDGRDEDYALDHGLALIGFQEVPSLEGLQTPDEFLSAVQRIFPHEKLQRQKNHANQLKAFVATMAPGDLVVLPRKLTSQIAIGQVSGPYRYRKVGDSFRHTRAVTWRRTDIPRSAFQDDLLYSLGAFLTVCRITRNEAEARIRKILEGASDPGFSEDTDSETIETPTPTVPPEPPEPDLAQLAEDQIVRHIEDHIREHAFARLVEAILKAEGWTTKLSPPGPDGGVDILAGRGSLGLDQPRLCVQVKSQTTPADVTVYRSLQGSMQSFKADQALLVCWGGFNRVVLAESKTNHFGVRLWDSRDVVEAIYRNYSRLPAEIQAELPLKQVWMLVPEDEEG